MTLSYTHLQPIQAEFKAHLKQQKQDTKLAEFLNVFYVAEKTAEQWEDVRSTGCDRHVLYYASARSCTRVAPIRVQKTGSPALGKP